MFGTALNGFQTHAVAASAAPSSSRMTGQPGGATAATKVGAQTAMQPNAVSTATAYFIDPGNGTFDASSGNGIVPLANSTVGMPILELAQWGSCNVLYSFSVAGPTGLFIDDIPDDPNGIGGNTVLTQLAGPSSGFLHNRPIHTMDSIASTHRAGNYTLHFINIYEDNVARLNQPAGSTAGQSLDHFSLTIMAVPELSSWALMILGFGTGGLGTRRGRKILLAAMD